MDSNHSTSAPSFSMRGTSLSELLASVRDNHHHHHHHHPQFSFSSLPMHSFASAHSIPLASARAYTLDPEVPFGNIPAVDSRQETRSAGSQFAVPMPSIALSSSPPQAASLGFRPENSSQPRRRSQRIAAHSQEASDSQPAPFPAESRKRKVKASSSRKRAARKKPPPNPKDDALVDHSDDSKPAAVDETKESEEAVSCCICMCEPEKEEVSAINGCDHLFCFECIGKWADRENTCPLCKSRFTSITRVNKVKKRKGSKNVPNSKRVKQRDQRADVISGPAIEAMLASIAAASTSNPGRLGRFLVALGSRRPPTLVAASRRTTVILEDDIFSDETDEDELPMIPFNTYMRNMQSMSRASALPSMFSMEFPPMGTSFSMPPPPPPPQFRTYASNTFEQNAGTPSNPLEIDLNDDDDDDEVEVFDPSV